MASQSGDWHTLVGEPTKTISIIGEIQIFSSLKALNTTDVSNSQVLNHLSHFIILLDTSLNDWVFVYLDYIITHFAVNVNS